MTRCARRPNGRFLIGLAVVVQATLSIPAYPHTHADRDSATVSWYPTECCHDGDCRPVASITPVRHGLWMTTVDGHTVLVGAADERRPSLDMRWHICLAAFHDEFTPRIQCIFEPPDT